FYAEFRTDAAGAWTVPVAPGRYRVEVDHGATATPVPSGGGTDVEVTTDPVEGMDLDLDGGAVQGRITGDGRAIQASVLLTTVAPGGSCLTMRQVQTDASGYYAIVGMPP